MVARSKLNLWPGKYHKARYMAAKFRIKARKAKRKNV